MKRALPFALGGALLGTVGGVALAFDAWWASWVVWFLYFAVVEGMALFNARAGDTLSEHIWAWFGTARGEWSRPVSGWTRLRRFVLLAFMAWLSVHFLTGGLF
ncbi:hypothetical protein ACPXB5_11220 [Micromonospora arida]|uniref:hypothetical protein n=1 Tax=Micromonospora arida TaxID=2203715 RepID=UPI003CF1D1F0